MRFFGAVKIVSKSRDFSVPKTVHTSRFYRTIFQHLVNSFPCSGDFIFIPERPSSSASAINLSISNMAAGLNYWIKENKFRISQKSRTQFPVSGRPKITQTHVMASNAIRCIHTHTLHKHIIPKNRVEDSDFHHDMLGQDAGRLLIT